MKKLKVNVEQLVAVARENIEEVEVADAITQSASDDCLVVDIRDVRERKRDGYIQDSFHCPRGMVEFWIDPESPYFKQQFSENMRFLFHCAVDWRSALTVKTVNDMGFKGAAHIKGGFKAWQAAGGPVIKPES
ncbi:MAG: rhodanese-related sulfurtransferase [Parasphingorhabdus sp.]|jgi:rhodanese-related sulfurtransferase